MIFVGDAVVEVRVGEGLRGQAGLLIAILPLQVVLPQQHFVLSEEGERPVRGEGPGEMGDGVDVG